MKEKISLLGKAFDWGQIGGAVTAGLSAMLAFLQSNNGGMVFACALILGLALLLMRCDRKHATVIDLLAAERRHSSRQSRAIILLHAHLQRLSGEPIELPPLDELLADPPSIANRTDKTGM